MTTIKFFRIGDHIINREAISHVRWLPGAIPACDVVFSGQIDQSLRLRSDEAEQFWQLMKETSLDITPPDEEETDED